jgi:ribosomal-protein-serine acetyltransferase
MYPGEGCANHHDVIPQPLLVDPDITLVPRHVDDAREMNAILERHRADLREWLTWVDAARNVAEVRRYAQFAQAQFETHVAFDYAIRAGGVIAGSIGLHGLDWASRKGEIGYWLSPDARGTGLVTRAARALVTHGLTHLQLHRIEIHCVVENAASRAVPERLGFALEGVLSEAYRLHARYRDIALYATTATRWTI